MTRADWNRIWIYGALFWLAFIALLSVVGCAAPRTAPPISTAAVRAPIVSAQVQVRRAVAIGKREQVLVHRAQSKGIAAGSEEARELSTLTLARTRAESSALLQLDGALDQTGILQGRIDQAHRQFVALSRDDQLKTARISFLRRIERWLILGLALMPVADYFAGAPIQRGLHVALRVICRGVAWIFHHAIGLVLRFLPMLLALI